MELKIDDEGRIQLDMLDIVREVVGNTPNDRLWELVEMFGWQDRVFKMVSNALAVEFSRENYNTHLHESREMFLKHIKQEEIKYYASLIASRVSDAERHGDSFWKLYHWCSEHGVFRDYPDALCAKLPRSSDWDFRQQLERDVVEAFKQKFPGVYENATIKEGK